MLALANRIVKHKTEVSSFLPFSILFITLDYAVLQYFSASDVKNFHEPSEDNYIIQLILTREIRKMCTV